MRGEVRSRGRNRVRTKLHPRRRLSWRISSRMQLVCGCSFQVVGGNFRARTQKSGGLGEGWDGALDGVFRTFPQIKKSAKLGSHSGSELLPESSPSTLAAHVDALSGVELLAKIQQLSDYVGEMERTYSSNCEGFSNDIDLLCRLITAAEQSGGYIRYAQRQVRTVFNLVTGAVLGQGCCLPVVFLPVRTVQTVQKTLTSAQFWVGRRHARWCANDRALVRQWRKLGSAVAVLRWSTSSSSWSRLFNRS